MAHYKVQGAPNYDNNTRERGTLEAVATESLNWGADCPQHFTRSDARRVVEWLQNHLPGDTYDAIVEMLTQSPDNTGEPTEPCADCGAMISALGEGRCYQCSCEAHARGEIDMDNDDWRGAVDRPRYSENYDTAEENAVPPTAEELEEWKAAMKLPATGTVDPLIDDIPF